MSYFIKKILLFFDFFHKKKIIRHLKNLNSKNPIKVIFDVGAHEGESILLFLNNFEINQIYSFEPSEITYKKLLKNSENFRKKFKKCFIHLENFAIGCDDQNIKMNYLNESSSSTLKNLNTSSNYFKKKERYFGKLINKKENVKQVSFNEYLNKKKIDKIDLLKIDTEGYEFEVIKGLKHSISKISIILFEHHYDNMIIKNYKFGDIHNLLKNNGFRKDYKIKMPFRKSFEYIYIKE